MKSTGRIYAKGRAELEDCYKDDFANQKTRKPHFDLQFGACGMKSLRSVSFDFWFLMRQCQ